MPRCGASLAVRNTENHLSVSIMMNLCHILAASWRRWPSRGRHTHIPQPIFVSTNCEVAAACSSHPTPEMAPNGPRAAQYSSLAETREGSLAVCIKLQPAQRAGPNLPDGYLPFCIVCTPTASRATRPSAGMSSVWYRRRASCCGLVRRVPPPAWPQTDPGLGWPVLAVWYGGGHFEASKLGSERQ